MRLLTIFIICFVALLPAHAKQAPELIGADFASLVRLRQQIKAGDAKSKAHYAELIKEADAVLPLPPEKVTDGDMPPSGDSHDFYNVGRYAWPNPKTPDGMPYVRIDCKINPEALGPRYDYVRFCETIKRVNLLARAWFYSQDPKYSEKAAELLRVWFLKPGTRMNPNFKNASAQPGINEGMSAGAIYGHCFVELLDHVRLLRLSSSWKPADDGALKDWFAEYVQWLSKSDLGRECEGKDNNLGTWHSAQVAAAALYAGQPELAKQAALRGKARLEEQIAPDGSFPHEMGRDWSYSYFIFNLRAFRVVAVYGERFDVDVWNHKTANGGGLKTSFEFLAPYISGNRKWEKGRLRDDIDSNLICQAILDAVEKYKTPALRTAASKLKKSYPNELTRPWF